MYKIENVTLLPEGEAHMLELVNQECIVVGLKSLEVDPELTEDPRRYSSDMLMRGYFSHYIPESKVTL